MAPIRITGAHNPVNQLEFEIELPGDEILSFTVPKLVYIAKPILDKYNEWLTDWQRKVMAEDTDIDDRATMREYDPILKLCELVLPKATYTKIAKLTLGELAALDNAWLKASETSLGESSASGTS